MSDIPLVEIPAELLAQMRERVWFHTASLFAVERSTPVYKGTATCVAVAKKEYLLTAAHVWRELRGDRFALSLEADRLLVPIHTSLVEPIVLSGTEFGEWGPDLALIRIPDLVARDIRQVKAFYNVDKRRPSSAKPPDYASGVWAVRRWRRSRCCSARSESLRWSRMSSRFGREIGIRLALGSTVREVMIDVGRSGIAPAALGLFLGLLLGAGALRAVRSALFGVDVYDSATIFGVLVTLSVVTLTAAVAPTLRVARIEPATTLREE